MVGGCVASMLGDPSGLGRAEAPTDLSPAADGLGSARATGLVTAVTTKPKPAPTRMAAPSHAAIISQRRSGAAEIGSFLGGSSIGSPRVGCDMRGEATTHRRA